MFSLQPWFRLHHCHRGIFSPRSSQALSIRLFSTEPPPIKFRLKVLPLSGKPLPADSSLARNVIKANFQSYGEIRDITLPVSGGKQQFFIDFEATENVRALWKSWKKQQKVTGVDGREFDVFPGAKPNPRVFVDLSAVSVPKSDVEAELAQFGKLVNVQHIGNDQGVLVEFAKVEDAAKAVEHPISLPNGIVLSAAYAHPPRKPTTKIKFFVSGPLRASAEKATLAKQLLDSLGIAEKDQSDKTEVSLPLDLEKPAQIWVQFPTRTIARKVMQAVESINSPKFSCTASYVSAGRWTRSG
ncbi:hypothetical protein C8J56DRAFT_963749 [Mycena floridula]|nr:hypothetical protein C8J56DRAFT_963749 [Mycena floridula]